MRIAEASVLDACDLKPQEVERQIDRSLHDGNHSIVMRVGADGRLTMDWQDVLRARIRGSANLYSVWHWAYRSVGGE